MIDSSNLAARSHSKASVNLLQDRHGLKVHKELDGQDSRSQRSVQKQRDFQPLRNEFFSVSSARIDDVQQSGGKIHVFMEYCDGLNGEGFDDGLFRHRVAVWEHVHFSAIT